MTRKTDPAAPPAPASIRLDDEALGQVAGGKMVTHQRKPRGRAALVKMTQQINEAIRKGQPKA
ncbi:MAG: hypothetical protein B7X99_10125 [Rhizobiales bacterium 17-65-6]|nr:MAG: hypothetical protein B7Z30_09325 [Rhizobiales bacterium 12-68-15]OYX90469.1 MAG: hypothetical protein B7Y84_00980 [Azorhizobium sp. 32-67-21]OYY10503.1 MAG: hypothetical protein B7Y70_08415 [Rhizobiales bacterium 35-68-8]OYZ98837.1 MAG: hypothetical protein B7X99_10125 [Rhizobiales bacterium 17-65-6]